MSVVDTGYWSVAYGRSPLFGHQRLTFVAAKLHKYGIRMEKLNSSAFLIQPLGLMPFFELQRIFARNPPENLVKVGQTLKATRKASLRNGVIQ